MALKTYNGTDYDSHLGTTNILTTTTNITTVGITSAGFTAPNTTNKVTGAWICISSIPSNASNNIVVTLQESTVDKVSAIINNADLKIGWNYVRFSTPYQFTTTSTGAYRLKVNSTVSNQGSLRLSSSNLAYTVTYDSTGSLGSTDDLWIGGFNNSGLTEKTCTLSGSNTFGSGTDKSLASSSAVTIGAGLTIGSGGHLQFDPTTTTTIQIRGTQFIQSQDGIIAQPNSKSVIHTLVVDNEAAVGQYLLLMPTGSSGGSVKLIGSTYKQGVKYVSGVGTAVSPLVTDVAHGMNVGDEIIVGGDGHDKSEIRFVKTVPSSTSLTLSTTSGGAEAALVNTHSVGSLVDNLTRNVIIKPQDTSRSFWIYNGATGKGLTSYFSNVRVENIYTASGFGFTAFNYASGVGEADANTDGLVLYKSATTGNRDCFIISNSKQQRTVTGITAVDIVTTNGTGNAAMRLSSCANQTINDFHGFSTTTVAGPMFAITGSAANNTVNDIQLYGGNAAGSAGNSAIYITASGNTFNGGEVNGSRIRAIYFAGGVDNVFNDILFANRATNTLEVDVTADTYNKAIFNNCTFGSATLIANYTGMLDGSRIGFHRYQDTDRRHRAFQPNTEIYSSGNGLTYTTADTTFDADSLAMRMAPLSATLYGRYNFYLPQRAGTIVIFSGKILKDASFNGDAEVNIYLDGEELPSQTYILSGADSIWHPIVLSADYTSGTYDRNARIEIKVRGTAGAIYLDTFFNAAKATNPIGSLDLWQDGVPNQYLVSTVASASEIAGAVWSDSTVYAAGTKGFIQNDTNLTNVLAKDALS